MGWNRRRVMMGVGAAITLSLAMGAAAQTLVTFPRGQAEVVTKAGKHHAFTVELATTHDQLTQGLMFRRTMAADAGMLFDFGEDKPVTMWMRNTLIPLDMLFIANDGRVVGIKERAVPQSSDIIAAPEPVRGVLELNGGTAQRLGLSAGDRVVHPMFDRK
jgi:uncharacterized membrane protein (UPF0127 family)